MLSTAGLASSAINAHNNRDGVQAANQPLGVVHPHDADFAEHHDISSDPEPGLPNAARELTPSPRTVARRDALFQEAGILLNQL